MRISAEPVLDVVVYDSDKFKYTLYSRLLVNAIIEKFNSLKTPKSWDEYMKEAEVWVQENVNLMDPFGYDLLLPYPGFFCHIMD